MLDTKRLADAVNGSGLKKTYIAQKLGVSRQYFYKKLAGDADFSVEEIKTLRELLRLSADEAESIFFA